MKKNKYRQTEEVFLYVVGSKNRFTFWEDFDDDNDDCDDDCDDDNDDSDNDDNDDNHLIRPINVVIVLLAVKIFLRLRYWI